jgi:transcriptional regulator with XRE-family HTH domain
LAEFLRTRRARLSPEEVGLPPRSRRHTPGLRREEVAELADIGITWYTWLEQGRNINASDDVLTRIAAALHLSPDDQAHLRFLANQSAGAIQPHAAETISPALQLVFDSLRDYPAYIHGRRWDILALNEAASALFGASGPAPNVGENLLWRVYTAPEQRSMLVDWEQEARIMLALFRVDYDRYDADRAWFGELLEALNEASPEFRLWWPQHEVRLWHSPSATLMHPAVGNLQLDRVAFHLDHSEDIQLRVFTPQPGTDSAEKLAAMLRWWRNPQASLSPPGERSGEGET